MTSLGEYRVGIDFNPSGDKDVKELKRMAAEFIDYCEDLMGQSGENPPTSEVHRLWALAMTHMEDAAMWAVKAKTKKAMT